MKRGDGMKGAQRISMFRGLAAAVVLLGALLAAPAGGAEGAAGTAAAPGTEPAAAAAGTQGKAARPVVPPEAVVAGTPVEPGRVGLRHYLAVSALVFGLGLMIIVIRRNAIAVLMGIELLINAAGLNFVAFSKYVGKDLVDGQVVTIFLIVIAAAEAAVALAIILNIYNNLNTVSVDEADLLKG